MGIITIIFTEIIYSSICGRNHSMSTPFFLNVATHCYYYTYNMYLRSFHLQDSIKTDPTENVHKKSKVNKVYE